MELKHSKTVQILLVEDNPGDVRLTVELFKDVNFSNAIHVVRDGVEAISFLRRIGEYTNAVRPDLVLLDLNLPRKNGREVLAEIKGDADLRCIPVVILTGSQAEDDIVKSYNLNANCYISKPVDLDRFITVVHAIQDFWLTLVRLPSP
jgi:two-component system, chemotaxis family, response regulator Rcp1